MSAKAIRFRLGAGNDAAAISALLTSLSRQYIEPGLTDEGRLELAQTFSVDSIRHCFAAGMRFHLVFEEKALIAVAATRDNSHLYFLFVAEARQGLGLGRQLWERAREACRRAGYQGPFTVNAAVNARGFYQRLGFSGEKAVKQRGVEFWPMETGKKRGAKMRPG